MMSLDLRDELECNCVHLSKFSGEEEPNSARGLLTVCEVQGSHGFISWCVISVITVNTMKWMEQSSIQVIGRAC